MAKVPRTPDEEPRSWPTPDSLWVALTDAPRPTPDEVESIPVSLSWRFENNEWIPHRVYPPE